MARVSAEVRVARTTTTGTMMVGTTGTMMVGTTGTMMVGTKGTTDSVAAPSSGSLLRDALTRMERRAPWVSWHLRTRLVAGFAAVLLVVGAGAFLGARQLLLAGVDATIEADLAQETEALRSFAKSNDPVTGRPFGNQVERMFDVYLARNAPDDHEALIAYVDGRASVRRGSDLPQTLTVGAELPRGLAETEQPVRGSVTTPTGVLEYLAVPMRATGRTLGVFVVAISSDLAGLEVGRALTLMALMLGILFSLAVWVAWHIVTKTLDRVRAVTKAALTTPISDPSARIDVGPQDREIAELGRAFNRVLGQRAQAFAAQERFTHGAVHRLQTPAAAMREHIERVQAHPRKEATRISLVAEELDRIRAELDDLFLLAQSERPDFLHLSTVDPRQVMKGVCSSVERAADRKWRIESVGAERIVADPERLGHAVSLVVQNAVTHTRDGDVIALGSVVLPGEARLWVRHRDRGTSTENDERSPERLAQGGSEDRSETWLAVTRAIARAHRGHVVMAGRHGEDMSITVVVPRDQPLAWNGTRPR
jgi:signal transduction histidine kinase